MPTLVSTDDKVEMINRIVGAGFRKLEVTSFSHPKLLPQFADAARCSSASTAARTCPTSC